jgi:hypothetical protein
MNKIPLSVKFGERAMFVSPTFKWNQVEKEFLGWNSLFEKIALYLQFEIFAHWQGFAQLRAIVLLKSTIPFTIAFCTVW